MAKTAPRQSTNENSSLRKELIDGLNQDLADEYQAIIMYQTFAATVKGPYRKDLSEFFRGEIPDELGHAEYLADKVVALGGRPTTRPSDVPMVDDARGMLDAVMRAERKAIDEYKKRTELAEEYGDVGLKVVLEEHISDETKHFEEVQKMLAGWREAA